MFKKRVLGEPHGTIVQWWLILL